MDAASEMYNDDWDIGAMLDGDVNGRYLRDIVDVLEQRRRELKRELDKGVTPNEFRRGEAELTCFDAAVNGLNEVWRKKHNS